MEVAAIVRNFENFILSTPMTFHFKYLLLNEIALSICTDQFDKH